MRILPLFTLLVFLLGSPENSWAGKIYRVVLFSDSITSGYQLQAQESFAAKLESKLHASGYEQLEVINIGKENMTTASATEDIELVRQKLPDVVIVQLGFVDAKRGVLASAIALNLNNIVYALKETGAYVILVGSPVPDGMGEDYKYAVTNGYVTVANTLGVPLYPSAVEGVAGNPDLTLADGIHPNTAGVEIMVNGIFPLVDTGLRWRYDVYMQELEQAKSHPANNTPGTSLPPAP